MNELDMNQICPQCGESPGDGEFSRWRWNGKRWEHNHGGQAGHSACLNYREMVDALNKIGVLFPVVNTIDKYRNNVWRKP